MGGRRMPGASSFVKLGPTRKAASPGQSAAQVLVPFAGARHCVTPFCFSGTDSYGRFLRGRQQQLKIGLHLDRRILKQTPQLPIGDGLVTLLQPVPVLSDEPHVAVQVTQ